MTITSGITLGLTFLIVVQFLFGVGEAGAFPNISKALYNWFPADSRGFAKSAIWMSARFMGGLTPLVWTLITANQFGGLHWREAIWIFAGIAAIWCVIFYFYFTNKPEQHSSVNDAEKTIINAGRKLDQPGHSGLPWGKLLRSRNLWALCMMYVVTNFCWYFLMYNHPGAMKKAFPEWNNTPSGSLLLALLSGAPLLVGMAGCLIGGILSDRYIRRTGNRKWGRRIYGMLGYGLAGICYFVAIAGKQIAPDNLWAYAIPLMFMGFFNDLIMAPAWATAQDIGGRYAATVSGAMNMFGNLIGAVLGIFVTGMILKAHTVDAGTPTEKVLESGYITCFALYGIVYFAGVGLWLMIDASKPILAEDAIEAKA
jgi:sugar phosphate permease